MALASSLQSVPRAFLLLWFKDHGFRSLLVWFFINGLRTTVSYYQDASEDVYIVLSSLSRDLLFKGAVFRAGK